MINLSTQLRDDYIALFKEDDLVSQFIENYNGEYKNIIVKEKYEKYPNITYPIITISEINNENVNQFFDDSGERVAYLSYQIEIGAEQNENYTALENVQRIADIIDTYMKGEKYWCMRRVGTFVKYPLFSDSTKMMGYLRYECNVDIKTNTIYRRS